MKFILCSLFLLLTLSFALDVTHFSSSQVLTVTGTTTGNSFQFPITNAGDINKDGKDDILIGGYGQEDGGSYESAYLIYGQSTFSPVSLDFRNFTLDQPSTGISIMGTAGSDGFGSAVSGAGDIDGDGNDDFMIGAFRKGVVYVVYGDSNLQNMDVLSPALDPSATGFTISGDEGEDYLGFSISKAGKINGDGLGDIIVGMHGKNNQTGAAIVIFGESRATRTNVTVNGSFALIYPETTGFTILGEALGDLFGYSVSNAGDVNKDGKDDIIIGAPGKGAAYVIYGSQSPIDIDLSIETLDPATTGFTVLGETAGDYFGISVGAAGDVNGDGIADIIIGANNTGTAYIIYGSQTPSNINLMTDTLAAASTGFVVKGSVAGDQLGASVTSLGDINGDTKSDVMIGAPGQGGAVHVIYGGNLVDIIDLAMAPLDPATTGFTFTRGAVDGNFGYSISSGDFNDDGKTELFVGTMGKTSTPRAGYIIDLSKMCSDNCTECSVPTTCGTCNTDYELIESTLTCRQCNVIGEFYSNKKCESCMSNCDSCTDGTSCDECSTGYVYENSTCVGCPQGKYLSGDKCDNCFENCEMCWENSTCLSCSTGYGRSNFDTECIDCTQPGKFLSNGECFNCIENCSVCSDNSTCEKCLPEFGLVDSVCVPCSGPGKFIADDGTCSDCLSHCDICWENSTCWSCETEYGKWNFDTECIECTQPGKLLSNGECFDCIDNCDLCSDTSTCEKCLPEFGLMDSVCISCSGPGQYIADDGVCSNCTQNCDVCSDDKMCNTCLTGFGRWNLDKECIQCPQQGKFLSNGECSNCIDNCDVCSDDKTCGTCLTGFGRWNLDKECIQCPQQGKFLSNGKCSNCIDNCNDCSDASTCNACKTGFGKFNPLTAGNLKYGIFDDDFE